MKELSATLRLQFHRDFTLDDAAELVDYFAALGISHLYASPLLTARPGSMHGYDVIDPTRINPELGGEQALQRLVAKLRENGMGLILDIVSNHMAVGGGGNPWWLDVLEWGRRSPYAQFFDIEWNSPDPLLEGQLLVPFLGSDYGEALQQGTVTLQLDVENGALYAKHYDHRFPITPPSYGEVLRLTEHPALRTLGGHFDALKTEPAPYVTARQLRSELAQLLEDGEARRQLEAALQHYDGTTAEASGACMPCSNASTIAWPAGAPRPTTSTGDASSISMSSAACGSSDPWYSNRPMKRSSSSSAMAWSTVCASTTSMAWPTRAATVGACVVASIA